MRTRREVVKIFDTCTVEQASVWHKFRDARPNRVGLIIQNQSTAANFWYSNGEKQRATDGQKYSPGTGTVEDIDADQGEIWVMSDTAGAGLTVIEKFARDVEVV